MEGNEFGGYDPSTAYEGIEPQVQPQGQGEGVQEFAPQEAPQAPELLDFGGRKLPVNEDLMGLHKDFTEQQRYITALQEQVNAYKQLAQTAQVQPQPQSQPQSEISPDVEKWDEETWQKFYDKPQQIIGQLIQNEIQRFAGEKLEPILQERQWNSEIQRMYDQYSDFDQYVGEVQTIINEMPDRYVNRDGGLEEAYFRAKATRGMAANPAQLAQDPQFLQQYVLSNPQVQNQVVQQYFQQKQQTNSQIPVTMGRGAGGFTAQTPDASPTTIKEASQLFMKSLGLR